VANVSPFLSRLFPADHCVPAKSTFIPAMARGQGFSPDAAVQSFGTRLEKRPATYRPAAKNLRSVRLRRKFVNYNAALVNNNALLPLPKKSQICSGLSARLMASAVTGKRSTLAVSPGASTVCSRFALHDADLRRRGPRGASRIIYAQRSRTIAQCLNLEHELHHAAAKLCILGFQTLKQSLIARTPLIKPRGRGIPH
jgi:hypothetical protein